METEIEVPPVIRWAPGVIKGGAPFGECIHSCNHSRIAVVGRGSDPLRTSLVRCVDKGCTVNPSVQCRAWYTEKNTPWTGWLAVWVGVQR